MYQLELARSVPFGLLDEEYVKGLKEAGILNIEFGICAVKIDDDPAQTKAVFEEKVALLKRFGIGIPSVHLPFGPTWELCVPDDVIRERAMKRYLELIDLCKLIAPKRFILHPGYPRVPQEERQERIENFRRNVKVLAAAAAPAKIAVENMPQDCLGNTARELLSLVEGMDELCLCCDMNHYYQETTYDAIRLLGKRIETIHVNDFDGVKEKHWLPGDGILDWNRILGELEKLDYHGPFLYECIQDHNSFTVAENKKMLFENYHVRRSDDHEET